MQTGPPKPDLIGIQLLHFGHRNQPVDFQHVLRNRWPESLFPPNRPARGLSRRQGPHVPRQSGVPMQNIILSKRTYRHLSRFADGPMTARAMQLHSGFWAVPVDGTVLRAIRDQRQSGESDDAVI